MFDKKISPEPSKIIALGIYLHIMVSEDTWDRVLGQLVIQYPGRLEYYIKEDHPHRPQGLVLIA
jgi:hypothetical protein